MRELKLEKDGEGFTITTIELTTQATVPGIDAASFQEIAEATKKACRCPRRSPASARSR